MFTTKLIVLLVMETLYLQQNPANTAHLKRTIEQLEKGNSVQVEIDE